MVAEVAEAWDTLISPQQLALMIGVRRDSLPRMVAGKRVPRPIRLSYKVVRWRLSDIEAWLRKLSRKGA